LQRNLAADLGSEAEHYELFSRPSIFVNYGRPKTADMTANVESGPPPAGAKYWAFISYSHRDEHWAQWLHRSLERYFVPRILVGRPSRDGKVPRRLFPIFRDREELPVSSDLGANLKDCLERSRYLIVVCSPDAAVSRWVNEEIRYFKNAHGEDRILCLIVAGEPNADDKLTTSLPECFPPAVRFRVAADGALTAERTEPIAADVRPGADGKANAKLKLIAGLVGVNYDELKQRDQRRRRRRNVLLLTLTALSLAAFISIIFVEEKTKARKIVKMRIQRLVQEGIEKMSAEKRLQALVYLAQAYHLEQSIQRIDKPLDNLLIEASISLPKELEELKIGGHDRRSNWVSFAQFNPDCSMLVTTSWDGCVRLWNLKDQTSRVVCQEKSRALSVNFSPHGDKLVVSYWNGLAKIWTLNGDLVATLKGHTGRVNYATYCPDGTKVITASDDSTAKLWSPNGDLLRTLSDHSDSVKSAVFSSDGTKVLTASFDGTVKVWDVASGGLSLTIQPSSDQDELNFAQFSPRGQYVAIAGLRQGAILWDLNTRAVAATFKNQSSRTNFVAFNNDGSLLLTASDDGEARVFNLTNHRIQMTLERHRGRVLCAEFSPNDTMIVSTGDDGYARVWDARCRALSVAEIASVVQAEVPWRLEQGHLVPVSDQ
jgi:hypothetical protein